jgi:hypothetical protein
MKKLLRPMLILCVLAVPAAAAAATPSGPIKGAHYAGVTSHSSSAITLKVSRNGKSVQVSMSVEPSFCSTKAFVKRQITAPARISRSGSFSGSISYFALLNSTKLGIVQFKGRFHGKHASGTLHSQFLKLKGCDGTTSFTAVKQ